MQVNRDWNVGLPDFRKHLNPLWGSSCPQDCRILQNRPWRAMWIYSALLLKQIRRCATLAHWLVMGKSRLWRLSLCQKYLSAVIIWHCKRLKVSWGVRCRCAATYLYRVLLIFYFSTGTALSLFSNILLWLSRGCNSPLLHIAMCHGELCSSQETRPAPVTVLRLLSRVYFKPWQSPGRITSVVHRLKRDWAPHECTHHACTVAWVGVAIIPQVKAAVILVCRLCECRVWYRTQTQMCFPPPRLCKLFKPFL